MLQDVKSMDNVLTLEQELEMAKVCTSEISNDDFIRFSLVAMREAEKTHSPLNVKIKVFSTVLKKLCESMGVKLAGFYTSVVDSHDQSKIWKEHKGFEFCAEIPSDDYKFQYFAVACRNVSKRHEITQETFSIIANASMELAEMYNKNEYFSKCINGFCEVLGEHIKICILSIYPQSIETNIEISKSDNESSLFYKHCSRENNIYSAWVL